MTESARRLRLGRRLAQTYLDLPTVSALLLTGSAARGWADRWSDLEVMLVWSDMPSFAMRDACAARCGASGRQVYDETSEAFAIDGIKIDLMHSSQESIEQTLHEVTVDADTDIHKHELLAAVRDCVTVHGHDIVGSWQLQAREYPPTLQRAMVDRNLVFGPHWWLEMLAERDDLVLLYDILGRIARAVVGIVLALNRSYASSDSLKWAANMVADLDVAPVDIVDRLNRMYEERPRIGARIAAALIDDTLELVALHRPDIDLAPVIVRVHASRPGEG